MTSAKQRAAARRNIKKARAALNKKKRSRSGGKMCFYTIKSLKAYMRKHGYKVNKK